MDLIRLAAVARKEALQLRRDLRSLILAFVLPLFMVVFFGYAINWDIKDIPMGVWDQEGSRQSRELVEAFRSSGYFTVTGGLNSYREAEERLGDGSDLAVLVIPPGFSRDLSGGRLSPVQILLDGADANTATIALNYAEAVVALHSLSVVLEGQTAPALVNAETRVWYNETLESRNMVIPGLIAVIMSIIAGMLTSLTIAREWERGTMEQLASTPVRAVEIVLGKLLPYLFIGLFDVAVVVIVGIVLFSVPFKGSVLLLGVLSVLFLLGALGLGIFISSVAGSQVVAMQVALISTFLPALLLSGFLFDIAGMPIVLRAVTYLVPARYFVTVTRGVLLKGVDAVVLWPQAVFMLAFAIVGLSLAILVFKKEIKA